jgi:myo-inositol 2-dehydrogenase/D-chiro-inositol 1-dehydrogenase
MNEKSNAVRFGLLGAGRIGRVHAKSIHDNPGGTLVAVTDAVPAAAASIEQQYGCQVRSVEAIETAKDIDAVIICTPTDTHADLIERFSRAGKAVFCEKPIDLDIGRVRTCLKVVEETNARLMVGFNRRFDPHFMAVRKAIDDGHIGDVEMVTIISRDPGLPPIDYVRRSGGIFRDMTIHDFDMARLLLREEPISVNATAAVLVDKSVGDAGDYDSASLLLQTKSGKQAMISNSRRATYGYDQRIEVHGSKGMVSAENLRPVSIELANSTGYIRPPIHDFFMTRYTQAYANELAAFIAAIGKGIPISPSGADGLAALALADAALKSVREKRQIELA